MFNNCANTVPPVNIATFFATLLLSVLLFFSK